MHKFISQRKFILRMLLLDILILFIIISLLSAYAVSITRNEILDSLSEMSLNMTRQANDFTEQFFEMVRTYSSAVFYSRSITRLRNSVDISRSDYIDGMRELRSYASATDYIHSIYVYNGSSDYIYTTLDSDVSKGSAPADSYFDKDSVSLLKNAVEYEPVYRQFPYGGKDSQVVSFLMYELSQNSGEVKSSMIINLSVRWLNQFVNSLNTMKGTFVYHEDGSAIITAEPDSPLYSLSKDEIADLIKSFNENEESPYLSYTIDGEEYLCFCEHNARLCSYFLRAVAYSSAIESAIHLRRNLTRIIMIIVLVGIGITVLVTRNLFIPVGKLLDRVPEGDSGADPAQSFNSIVDKAAGELDKYSRLMHTEFLRRQILFRPSSGISQNDLDRRRIPFSLEKPFSIVLSLPASDSKEVSSDSAGIKMECVPVSSGLVYLLQSEDSDALTDVLGAIREASSFCAYASDATFFSLCDCYAQLRELYDLRIFLPSAEYYTPELLSSGGSVYPKRVELRIISALSSGSAEKAMTMLEDFFNSLVGSSRYSSLKAHLSQLYSSVASLDTSDTYASVDIVQYFSMTLSNCCTLDELRQAFQVLFYRVAEQNIQLREEQEKQLFLRVKEYLDSNYMDSEITVQSLAEMENSSPEALADLFKKNTQTSIAKYLLQQRLARASELLLSTTIPVKEIALMVGFSNPQYFFTLFKNAFGETPSSFRERGLCKQPK